MLDFIDIKGKSTCWSNEFIFMNICHIYDISCILLTTYAIIAFEVGGIKAAFTITASAQGPEVRFT